MGVPMESLRVRRIQRQAKPSISGRIFGPAIVA
jgi:hypothetical protein